MIRLTDAYFIQSIIDQLEGGTYDYILSCQFPLDCHPSTGQLVFSTNGTIYSVYLHDNIVSSSDNPDLRQLCDNGYVNFASPKDIQDYFISMTRENTKTYTSEDYCSIVDNEEIVAMCSAVSDTFLDPDKLAKELKQNIFGQDEVVEELSEKLAIHMLHKQNKLFSTIMFGKTGTGKSSLAKALPIALSKLTQNKYGFIEIAGNELPDTASMTRFFGAPPEYVGHGKPTFFSPIKDNPYMVVVINEIEKATDDLFTRLMECLDTSSVQLADNTQIDLSRCIFIFTSNLPIDTDKLKSLSPLDKVEYLRDEFTKFCNKPEIAARIGSFCVFKDLDREADIAIFTRDITSLLDDFGLELKKIDSSLIVDLIRNKSAYGARAHMYTIEETIGKYLIRHRELRNSHKAVVLKGNLDTLQIEAA